MDLFRFIGGANESGQKIPMTTPVYMGQYEDSDREMMAFVMPLDMSADEVPEPLNKDLTRVVFEAGRFAVYSYSGYTNDSLE